MVYKIIALGMGQCSSVLPFMKDWLKSIDYDEIVFCDTGKELGLTYEHLEVMKNHFDITVLQTSFKKSHPPYCTKDAKILPTRRYLRSKGIDNVLQYVGYTIEEKKRAKQPDVKWIKYRFPLIEQGFTRRMCQDYLLKKLGYVPARSGCIDCKYFDRHYLITRLPEGELNITRRI